MFLIGCACHSIITANVPAFETRRILLLRCTSGAKGAHYVSTVAFRGRVSLHGVRRRLGSASTVSQQNGRIGLAFRDTAGMASLAIGLGGLLQQHGLLGGRILLDLRG